MKKIIFSSLILLSIIFSVSCASLSEDKANRKAQRTIEKAEKKAERTMEKAEKKAERTLDKANRK